jgi:formylglycine-generating enzyme required for sulfatase activity
MNRIFQRAAALIAVLAMHLFTQSSLAQTSPQRNPVPSQSSLVTANGSPMQERLARRLSRNEEAALRPADYFRECERCPEMVVVPAGKFTMGANASEAGSTADERPQHEVSFAKAFAVGRLPVTSDQWDACVSAQGCSYRPPIDMSEAGQGRPVRNISWDDANEYVWWLSRTTGKTYRLLSESEREYVTRAGSTTAFWWGDSITPVQPTGRAENNYPFAEMTMRTKETSDSIPSLVTNPWGLQGVHGAVYDWVADCWNDNYEGAPEDGSAWTIGNCSAHILRGGAFGRPAQTLRSASRLWFGAPHRLNYMSVRVARTLAQ